MSQEGTFEYSKRSGSVELDKEFYTLSEVIKITQLSPVWVRRMIKQKKLAAKKVDGKWLVKAEALRDKMCDLQMSDERMERRSKGEFDGAYQVPSLKSCDIIERQVRDDAAITEEARELFLQRIESYREYFTSRLVAIREERNS